MHQQPTQQQPLPPVSADGTVPAPIPQQPQQPQQIPHQHMQHRVNGAVMAPYAHPQPQFVPHPQVHQQLAQPALHDLEGYNQFADGSNAPNGNRVLKISAGSNPKTVAGAISHITRQGDSPQMLATGAPSINQAIKAVAISRGYLEENKIELTCYPEFRADKKTGLSLIITKSVRRAPANDKDVQQLKVSKGSNPNHVAGAIANKLRDGERVWVLAIGAESVCHAVKAIAVGRKYLEADGMDISFRPEFTKVKFDDGRDCSALKFVILAQQE